MDPDSRTGPASAGFTAIAGPPETAVIVADPAWRRMAPRVEHLVRRAARLGGGASSVLLTSDAEVRRLNWRYRGRNKPTNVLTFPDEAGGGDIAVASGVVRREARAAGRTVAQHLAHMVVHGALHLRGHDHGGAGEARRMEMTEARLLQRLGVPNPWRSGLVPNPGRFGG